MLIREIIEPLSINREYECPTCGMRYRGQRDGGCPRCLGGDPEKPDREVIYRGPMGSREEQEEFIHEVRGRYITKRAMGIDGRVAMREIAILMGLKLTRIQGIIRRARKEGLL